MVSQYERPLHLRLVPIVCQKRSQRAWNVVTPTPYLQARIKCAHGCGYNLRDTKRHRELMERHERERCRMRDSGSDAGRRVTVKR